MAELRTSDQLRSWRDYALFVASHQSRQSMGFLCIDAVFLLAGVIGVATSLQSAPLAFLWPIGRAIWGVFKFSRSLQQLRQKGTITATKSNTLVKGGNRVSLSAIQPSDRQTSLGFVHEEFGKDSVIWSRAVNDSFQSTDWECVFSDSHTKSVRRAISENRDFCLRHLTWKFESSRNKALFINEHKWSLASELDHTSKSVNIHEGGYFDSFCTNESCTTTLRNTANGDERSGILLFPIHFKQDGTAHLDDLEVAAVNNHVGISTLAITADRYIVVWQQGALNIQDPGKIVATGSGSGDFGDVSQESLKGTVTRGMERELHQEALKEGLPWDQTAIAHTEVIGFFRWLSRGGKPEFVGVTRLAVGVADVTPDHREVYDITNKRTQRRLQNRFFVGDLSGVSKAVNEIRAYEGRGGALNLPLKVILARLEQLATSDPAALSHMLFGD